jgi:hypothetical protein
MNKKYSMYSVSFSVRLKLIFVSAVTVLKEEQVKGKVHPIEATKDLEGE